MEFNPKISIVIPVYNGSDYLAEAIDSALSQTYKNTEILVVNDGSADEGKTESIALSYGDKIKYLPKENGGVASALNKGIAEMSGDYFSWLSHDDTYFPEKLEYQINYLLDHGKGLILYSDYDYINEQSKYLDTVKIDHVKPKDFFYYLIMKYQVHGCTLLIPRECFDLVGKFDEKLKTTQDYDLWFKMSKRFDFVHLPKVLVHSRLHAAQGTLAMSDIHLRECNELYIKVLEGLSSDDIAQFTKDSQSLFFCRMAMALKRKFSFKAADYCLQRSFRNFLRSNVISAIKFIPCVIYAFVYRPFLTLRHLTGRLG